MCAVKQRSAKPARRIREQDRKKRMTKVCLSRINAKFLANGKVMVWYVSAHTNHTPNRLEMQYIPLPEDVKDTVSQKLALGVTMERILDGM